MVLAQPNSKEPVFLNMLQSSACMAGWFLATCCTVAVGSGAEARSLDPHHCVKKGLSSAREGEGALLED